MIRLLLVFAVFVAVAHTLLAPPTRQSQGSALFVPQIDPTALTMQARNLPVLHVENLF